MPKVEKWKWAPKNPCKTISTASKLKPYVLTSLIKLFLQSFVSFYYEGMHLKMAKKLHFLSLNLKIDFWIHKNQTEHPKIHIIIPPWLTSSSYVYLLQQFKAFYSLNIYLKTIKNTTFATKKPKLDSKSTRIWVCTLKIHDTLPSQLSRWKYKHLPRHFNSQNHHINEFWLGFA